MNNSQFHIIHIIFIILDETTEIFAQAYELNDTKPSTSFLSNVCNLYKSIKWTQPNSALLFKWKYFQPAIDLQFWKQLYNYQSFEASNSVLIKHKNSSHLFKYSVLKLNKNSEANSVERTALMGVFIYTFYLQWSGKTVNNLLNL